MKKYLFLVLLIFPFLSFAGTYNLEGEWSLKRSSCSFDINLYQEYSLESSVCTQLISGNIIQCVYDMFEIDGSGHRYVFTDDYAVEFCISPDGAFPDDENCFDKCSGFSDGKKFVGMCEPNQCRFIYERN